MKARFRQSMGWLHTWSGVVFAWLLYFIFVTGSVGYFENEIDRWMKPEIVTSNDVSDKQAIELAMAQLAEHADDASQWYVSLPTSRDPYIEISWLQPGDPENQVRRQWHEKPLRPESGEVLSVRDTSGGETLYRLHYNLHYVPPLAGYILTSLAGMLMLTGLVTGVIIHRKIFAEFFTFRNAKGLRSWLDIHNVFSVLPLPFHFMITYSGVMLLMGVTMSQVIDTQYGEGRQMHRQFYDASQLEDYTTIATEILPAQLNVDAALADAKQRVSDQAVNFVGVIDRNTANEHIEIWFEASEGVEFASLLKYHARAERVEVEIASGKVGRAAAIYDLLEHLHEGLFADIYLRWLYFLCGLFGAAMIASGMIIWLKKQMMKEATPSMLIVLIVRLNRGVLLGLPIAIGCYFLSNRLLPVAMSDRAAWEMHTLFTAILLCCLYCLTSRSQAQWLTMLRCTTLVYVLVPLVNMLTTDHSVINSLLNEDWLMLGFDLSMLLFAGCFGLAAAVVSRQNASSHIAKKEPLVC
ncbi:PepSY-associated TM helix domain-containing protein [Pseudoalteromonas sp. OOF1S-7]|uniref:PepSY-associated TM helix domain-containing protein n=1 Tax=Pseudoalteromonas sp. OOF1S-7 TaxID=2917757 RepID=UPI001EF6D09E|nr:PepSY-associated TM helix domain-containing protein [Pseudoalteromonas sp. OOF1S-7]MCG7534164.1 PepSY domain-containing protein [Pseudoalteromonas sp. OOF1S-7]